MCREMKEMIRDLAKQIVVLSRESLPEIILAVSPCRSASTVFLRVFGHSGISSHHQPLKTLLRWRLAGLEKTWELPAGADKTLFIKETIGPHTEIEACFNPLSLLLASGFPADRLQVVVMGRAPLCVWDSWNQWWGDTTSVERLIQAYSTVEQIRQEAIDLGITVTHFAYESLNGNVVGDVVEKLLTRVGVPSTPAAHSGWSHLPGFHEPGSNVVLHDMPPNYHQWGHRPEADKPHWHSRMETTSGIQYFSRRENWSGLVGAEVKQILESWVLEIHEGWMRACERDLDLQIAL